MKFSDYHKQKWPGPVSQIMLAFRNAVFPSPRHRSEREVITSLALDRVAAGPFSGMLYGPNSGDGIIVSRLLGTYEKEVYPAVEAIIEHNPDVVVVAGAGEGYFAVGLGRRLPNARIIAFEMSRWSNYLLSRHAKSNGVSVKQRGMCTPATLAEALEIADRPAVICDIEGGELDVLDLHAVPQLKRAHILVELHPMYIDGIEATICGRFEATHDSERMVLLARTADDIRSDLRGTVPDSELVKYIDEFPIRGSGTWLYMRPKYSPPSA